MGKDVMTGKRNLTSTSSALLSCWYYQSQKIKQHQFEAASYSTCPYQISENSFGFSRIVTGIQMNVMGNNVTTKMQYPA